MTNFDNFEEMLGKCKSFNNSRGEPLMYLCSFTGSLDPSEELPQKFRVAKDNTQARVIVYNVQTKSISRKTVKHNKKGYFINHSHPSRVYLTDFV